MKRFIFTAALLILALFVSACDENNNKRHSDNHDSNHDNNVSQDNWSPEKRELGEVFESYCVKMKGCYEAVEPDLEYNLSACYQECTMITDYLEDEACVAAFTTVYTCIHDDIPCSTFFSDRDESEVDEELKRELNKCADKSPIFRECKDTVLKAFGVEN